MLQIQAKENKCIRLGRRGEDSAREVVFDITGFAELYGQGEAQLIVKRDRDLESYLATITQNDTTVSWVIKPVDNDQPGYGNCELVYITDGKVAKSSIYQTHTDVSLSDPISPPNSPSIYGDLERRIKALEEKGGGSGGISQETDPTVPDWAKSETKPTYTASEVGALSADSLPEAINDALAQAKASGEFDGKDYVLTEDDMQEIAERTAPLVVVPSPEIPDIPVVPEVDQNAVQYVKQELTEEQQTQVRKNLGLYHKETIPESELVFDYVYVGWWEVKSVDTFKDGFSSSKHRIVIGDSHYELNVIDETQNFPVVGTVGYKYLGNPYLVDPTYDDNGCPVCFVYDYNSTEEAFTITIDPNLPLSMGLTIEVYELTGQMVEVIQHIPEEFLPESVMSGESVRTTPQEFSNEQQMQVRKNLGLYATAEEPLVLGRVDSVNTKIFLRNDVTISGWDVNVLISKIVSGETEEYTSMGTDYYDYGNDIWIYYSGNASLLDREEVLGSNYGLEDNGLPYVVYSAGNDDIMIYIDESMLESPDRYGIYDILVSIPELTEYKTYPVPEEFIPDTIARKWDIPEVPEVPVQSVNGKTGTVQLSAEDIGALPNDTAIPSKTSQLTNDSSFITIEDLNTETWTFTLESGGTVTKKVVILS